MTQRPVKSATFYLVSVVKLDAEAAAQTAAGWFERLWKNYTSSGIPGSHITPVALRDRRRCATSPPQPRRGAFVQSSEFAPETSLTIIDGKLPEGRLNAPTLPLRIANHADTSTSWM